MTPLLAAALIALASVVAGCLGSLLGLGGGVLVVPLLTLAFGVDVRLAIAASIMCIVATSVAAAPRNLRGGLANLRVAVLLETGTVIGALGGALLAGEVSTRLLYVVFGLVLALSALQMVRAREDRSGTAVPPDSLADALQLHGEVTERGDAAARTYRVTRVRPSLALMVVAGLVSGLLGVGSGTFKVPAMDLAMRLPIRVSTATSNLMIGVTGASSALVYLQRGDVVPALAGPVALGIVVGARLGAVLLPRVPAGALRRLFVVVLLAVSVQMLVKGAT